MIFNSIWNKIKEMIKNMIGARTVEEALKVSPVISSRMSNALQLWTDMYMGKAPWLHEPDFNDHSRVVSLGLAASIASEKARMATLEMKSEITVPVETVTEPNPEYTPPKLDELGNYISSGKPETITTSTPLGDSQRAEYLNEQYQKLLDNLRIQLEYGIAKGGLVIKPYIILNDTIENSTIEFDYIQADAFFPISFNASGKVTEAAFIQRKCDKNTVYTRLEYHKLAGNVVTIKNRAFKSTNTDINNDINNETDLGTEIKLSEVPEWKDIPPETQIKDVDRLLFAYFKMPIANTIDPHSPLGVSGYSKAVNLIKDADNQYSRLLWEFEGGQLAIDIDRDALKPIPMTDSNGVTRNVSVMGKLQERLYRPVDLGSNGDTYNVFSPALRDNSLINGLNNILMRIEDVTELSRGTLSDAAAEARTATELNILKQRTYSANHAIQEALESTLKDVVYIMNVYAQLYNITTDGDYDVSFEWDDSILVDKNEELTKRITLMQNGLASKVEVRMWYFGETEEQAREALNKISEENRQAMEDSLMNDMGNFQQ